MKITENLIDELAHLARMEFKDAEKQKIKEDLEKVTGFIEILSKLDTTNVEPLIYITENINNLREDKVKQELDKQKALDIAPDADSDFVRIPKLKLRL